VENLLRNWPFHPPLRSGNEGEEEDTRLMRLEDITAEELEAEYELFQLELSDAQDATHQQVRPLPGKTPPPNARLHEVYDLKEIDAIRKGVAPKSASEPTIHNRAEQPGV
jgi:hypothetical protein